MSQENVEVARRLYQLWNRGEPGWNYFAPDIEWDVSRFVPDLPEVARGQEEVRRLFQYFLGTWAEVRFEPEQFMDHGDRVVVTLNVYTRGRDSGVPVELNRIAHVFTLRDGLVTRHVQYPDPESALQAAGLPD